MLTQERLKEVLRYNPKTGIFTWNLTMNSAVVSGTEAGALSSKGYIGIGIDSSSYQAHRLVWLYVHGYLPENQIDHINRIRTDNRLKNLREVTQVCNSRNCGNPKNNKSGIKGVCFVKQINKWTAQIAIKYKTIHLGCHSELIEAACHRLAAEQFEDWPNCDNSSPAFKYVQKYCNRQ